MHVTDRRAYVERYERRLHEHGHSPLTLGWGKPGRESVRFEVMAELIDEVGGESVLDVGCGFADLYDHLKARGWKGSYHGIDIVPGLLAEALTRHPELSVAEADIANYLPGERDRFDVAIASGVFNARLQDGRNDEHIRASVTRMFELSRQAICVDFMSTNVDFQHASAWHTDPCWALTLAASLGKRFSLRHDYMPFEFALAVYRDDDHPGNVFRAHR